MLIWNTTAPDALLIAAVAAGAPLMAGTFMVTANGNVALNPPISEHPWPLVILLTPGDTQLPSDT